MADGVVVARSPLGDRFISIKYERGGSVVHYDCAPLANITFPVAVPSPPDSPRSPAVEQGYTQHQQETERESPAVVAGH